MSAREEQIAELAVAIGRRLLDIGIRQEYSIRDALEQALAITGYRIVGPGEMDAETLERAAQAASAAGVEHDQDYNGDRSYEIGLSRGTEAAEAAICSLAKGGGDGRP